MKASCRNVEYWISARVDGEPLPPDTTGRLEEHLESCAACRELLETERDRAALLSSALSPTDQQESLEEMKSWVLQRVRQHDEPGVGRSPGRWALTGRPGPLSLGAAAALLVGVAGWLMWSGDPPPPVEDVEPWRVTYEQLEWGLDPVPGEDGAPLKREVLRRRDLHFDDGEEPAFILDRERVDTRYIQFTDYR